jgi:hypothetical protein
MSFIKNIGVLSVKQSERDNIAQRFIYRLGLVFSSDPNAQCNQDALKKLDRCVKSKMDTK